MGCMVTGARSVPFFPSGMNKAGSSFGLTTSFAKVTGWTADGSYPGSSVVSDGLVAQGPKPGATIAASAVINNSSGPNQAYIQLKVGATVVASTGPISVGTLATVTLTATNPADVSPGDLVTLEARSGSGTGLSVTVHANTWVRIT